MLYYQIKNYEDFKNGSDLQQRENGVISRKNKNIARTFKESPVAPVLFDTQRLQPVAHIRYGRLAEKVTEAVKSPEGTTGSLQQGGTDRGNLSPGLYRTNESKGICEVWTSLQSVISMSNGTGPSK